MLLVKDVMTKEVVTFTQDTPIIEATRTLTMKRIRGAPVVDNEGRVIGIVSESDITKLIKKQAEGIKKYDNLSEKYATKKESTYSLDFLRFLNLDWLSYQWDKQWEDNLFKIIEQSEMFKSFTVKQVMTSKVVTIRPDETLLKVIQLMNRHDINRIPVVDELNRVKGIVARADIVKAIADELSGKGSIR